MRRGPRRVLVAIAVTLAIAVPVGLGLVLLPRGDAGRGGPDAIPTADWRVGDAESLGFDPERLEQAALELAERSTQSLLVIRKDRIAYEWYAPGTGPDDRHYTASLAKSLVGGMSLVFALDAGKLALDDPAARYIPAWREDPVRSRITLRQLATHTSGLDDAEQDGLPHDELPGWKGAFWEREEPDPFSIAIHETPVQFEPGTRFAYSNPGMAALAYAVTASLAGSPEPDLRSLFYRRLAKVGIDRDDARLGYGRTFQVDGLPLVASWGGGGFTPRAVARIGRLMLQRGQWEGAQLFDPSLADAAVAYAGTPLPDRSGGDPIPATTAGWYTNFDGVWPRVPRDAFAGAGAGQQVLLVVPSLDLIVVRMGRDLGDDPARFWGDLESHVFEPILDALRRGPGGGPPDAAPAPPSPAVADARFAPRNEIERRALGSDNWPLTVAADGEMFTAYGDGLGFEPGVGEKLSLGLARVLGGPEDFRGENLRAPTLEQRGDGPRGRKASSLLAVGERLYAWARNAGNAQLAWSDDGGQTWSWADWRLDESFGHPAFLQFGPGYAGARDDFVYVYSHDASSAYDPADRMVLARVPRDAVLDRARYEFFVRRGPGGAHWSSDVERRGAVFEHPGRCYRSSVSYHAPSGRYLWVQILPGEGQDTRFHGGFGIYDAPEPWGPWTTVFYRENWDVGPGENAHLPTKWMHPDGRRAWMVFSGDDRFSVRALTLEPLPRQPG